MDRMQYFRNRMQSDFYDQPKFIMNITVLFVRSGFIGGPYTPMEESIITHLEKMVRKVIVAIPQENVAAIALTEKPDLVLVFSGLNFPSSQIQAIRQGREDQPRWTSLNLTEISSSSKFSRNSRRKEASNRIQPTIAAQQPPHDKGRGIKTAVWFVDDPYSTDLTAGIAPFYDYVFTIEASCVPFYQSLGCKHVLGMPLASDPQFFYPKSVDPSYETDILFIGSAYWNRVSFFNEISDYLMTKNFLLSGWWWDRLARYRELKNNILLGKWMPPQDTANYYNGAKIVINLHRSDKDDTVNKNWRNIPAHSVNPRTFEIAGCGVLQLSDVRDHVKDVYEPRSELITFQSSQDFIEKAEWYLQNEQARHEVAWRSLARTSKEHTYEKRIAKLLNSIFPDDTL